MNSRISPAVEQVFEQLLWIERRRFRILESVSAHFTKAVVDRALNSGGPLACPLAGEPSFLSLLDENEPVEFVYKLAKQVETCEATTVTRLRTHVSLYREHVDEQIIFGSRTAGQEAGRSFLSRAPIARPRKGSLNVPEAVQAVFELNYSGLPGERNHFLVLRSHGGSSAHYSRSPHLSSWQEAGAETSFMYLLQCEWIKGILDIVSPQTDFSSAHAIERGDAFGLEHFFLRGQHAGP